MRTWRHIFLLLAIGLCGSGAFAGSRNVEDISNLTIHSFAQDLKGYVWIATDNGLCRYNGNDYLHYYHDAEGTGSLPSNTVLSLVTDDDGVLWVATDRGVCWYDGTNDSFELVDGVPGVSKLAFNDGKVICYGAGQGMTLLDPKKKRIDSVHNTPSHDVAVLVADKSGCLWGGHSDGIHIVKFDKSAAVVASEALPEKSAFRSVAVDSLGRVWFGRNDGLLIRDTGTMESVEDSRLAKLAGLVSGHAVTTILSVLGTMYVCMPGVGIYTVELDDGSVRKDAVKRFDLSYTSDFSCGFRDSENHPWIGTMDRGYGVRFLEKKNFKYVPALGRATSGKYINCVTASVSSNTVWMASYYKGLLAFDIPTSKHVWYNYGKCKPLDAIGEKGVKALALDGKNRLWIAMAGKVAVCGTRGSEILDSKVVADGIEVNAFCEDGDWTMWAATPVGVVRLDGGTDDCRLLQGSDIQDIIRFDEDRLLVAVKDSGLFFVAPKTLRVERYLLAGDDAKRNLGDVSCLYIQNGELWIGTSSKGLLRCRGNEVVNEYSIRNGLGSNDVASIAADPEGNVWVGTSYGLSVVTKRFDKPITYYQGRWMDTQQFCKRSAGSHSGRMFFGGNMGLAFFFSDRIISNISDEPVNVVLTGLSVNGVDQKPGKGEILDRLLDDTDRIVLKSSQNSIGIRFEPVSFIAEDNIGFSYRLTGKYADDEWNDIGGYRRVNFSHLPPGHYVFELKASNVDGFWSKDPRRLEIIIRKSPWLSWYALLAYLSLAVAGMMAVSRFIIKRRMEEMELQAAKDDLNREKRLSEMKVSFFTNISHELRTSLALVYGPVNMLSRVRDKTSFDKMIESINYNMRNLLNLVDQLLNLSRIENGALPLSVSRTDVPFLLRRLADGFSFQAHEKSIELTCDCYGDLARVPVDAGKLARVVVNLVSNALKYTPEGGHVRIVAECVARPDRILSGYKTSASYLQISVTDDGIGMKDEDVAHIFDRYTRLAQTESSVTGTGIGLHYVKELLRIHGGAVNAQVRKEGGMRFVFALPADESLYEITESAKDFRSDVIDGMLVVDPVKDEAVEEDGNSERYKVLVVEDNASLLAWLKEILSSRYDVYTASDGADALDIVNDVLPDMVLTDIIMPKVDGYELCRRIKEDKLLSHIPVVILTSRTGDEDRLIGYQHGADLYVTKPFSAEMIMTLIGNVLATREKLRERFTSQEEIEDDGRQGNEADIISAEDRAFIDRLRKYIEDNISETSISITSLAGEMCMSRASFFRKMKSLTGMTPNDFILTYRVNKAAAMLREGKWRIGEIADMLGFSSASHFSRVFRHRFGKTPKEFTQ